MAVLASKALHVHVYFLLNSLFLFQLVESHLPGSPPFSNQSISEVRVSSVYTKDIAWTPSTIGLLSYYSASTLRPWWERAPTAINV